MDRNIGNLVGRIRSAAKVSETEAHRIATEMCVDGIRSAAEAEALLEFNAVLNGRQSDWDSQFIRAMRDYLLLRTVPEGGLSAENLDWLRVVLTPEGFVSAANELDLLILLQKQAESLPDGFGLFVQGCICEHIVRQGHASHDDVLRLRRALSPEPLGGEGWIGRDEARLLIKTNDRLGRVVNDPAWNDLFARAIGNHLLARSHPRPASERLALSRGQWLEESKIRPGQSVGCLKLGFSTGRWFENINAVPETAALARLHASAAADHVADPSEAQRGWLRRRLGWDSNLSQAERALVDFLNAEAPGLVSGLVIAAG